MRACTLLLSSLALTSGLRLGSRIAMRVRQPPARGAAVKCAYADTELVGEWELEELEDSCSCKTLVQLLPDGTLAVGFTSAPPHVAASGNWAMPNARGEMTITMRRAYAAPDSLSDEPAYETMRTLRGSLTEDEIPGTIALVGELDMAAGEITSAEADSELCGVGHFKMIKIVDEEANMQASTGMAGGVEAMPSVESRHKNMYTKGESDATRKSLAERFS